MELIIDIKPEYLIIIGASTIIILSFIFNFLSKKTNIPSVLLLMVLGFVIQIVFPELKESPMISNSLVIVGKVGLILIVLEAALDLKIQRDKINLILKSLAMALFGLLGSAFLIAYILQLFLDSSFYIAFLYAVPLSIMSSAIIIPSVVTLAETKKELMIYESTFSDILGIILFQFLVSADTFYSTSHIFISVTGNILLTIFVAIVFSYVAVWGMQRLTAHVKLFLIIAVLMLVYAIGSVFHLSSLIIVLFFGLILNNTQIFFRGRLEKAIDTAKIKEIFKEFYIITLESAFVLRTFFFVIFGLTISFVSLVNLEVAAISMEIIFVLYAVRFVFLKIFFWKKSILPELFIAPRGLITILLFYSIPSKYMHPAFDQGILLYTILFSSFIMMMALVFGKGKKITDVIHDYDDLQENIETCLEDGHLGIVKDCLEKTKLEENEKN